MPDAVDLVEEIVVPFEQAILSVARGVAQAQKALDQNSIEIQKAIDADPELAALGLNAPWFQMPENGRGAQSRNPGRSAGELPAGRVLGLSGRPAGGVNAMSRPVDDQELARASSELDEAERAAADLAAANKLAQRPSDDALSRSMTALEHLLAPDFQITRASGKVDDRAGFLGVVKSGDRRYYSHKTSVDRVRAVGDGAVVTGIIETDGEYSGKPVRGRFRFTKVFAKGAAGWECVAWQNTPIPEDVPDAEAVRTVYAEICGSHAGITDFRAKLLALLPLASGTGLFLLLGESPVSQDKTGYLLPLGFFGGLVTLGLYLYELRGIQVCKMLRERGKRLEEAALLARSGLEGAFSARPRARGFYVGAEGASHLVYSVVIGSWGYLACVGKTGGTPGVRSGLLWAGLFVLVAHAITQVLSRLLEVGAGWVRVSSARRGVRSAFM
jgi:hypothetical protein